MDDLQPAQDPAPISLEADAPVIEVARFGRRRVAGPLAGLTGVSAWVAYILAIDPHAEQPGLYWSAFGILVLLTLVAVIFYERAVRQHKGSLRASREGVAARWETRQGSHTERVPREQIDSAVAGASSVSYKLTDGRTLSAQLAPGMDPDAMIRVVGLAPEKHRASLRLRSGGRALVAAVLTLFTAGPCVALAAALGAAPWTGGAPLWTALLTTPIAALIGLVAPALTAYVLFARWHSVRTTVGTDGVVIHSGLRDRFVAYDDVQAVAVRDGLLSLYKTDGRVEHIDGSSSPADAEALRVRIEQAREVHARGGAGVASRALLQRGSRSLADWRASLAQLAAHQGGYRDVALSMSELRALVRDTTAALEHRVAAALALAGGSDPADRDAIRTAAASVASERVRVVMESIAEGRPDDDAIEGALRADVQAGAVERGTKA